MPLPPPAHIQARKAAAEQARLQRSRRIDQLRRQVLVAALSTFAIAFGFVAFDGSMGAGRSSSASASSPAASAPQDTGGTFDDTGGADGLGGDSGGQAIDPAQTAPASDGLTTSQS
jgi:hypothetical protein